MGGNIILMREHIQLTRICRNQNVANYKGKKKKIVMRANKKKNIYGKRINKWQDRSLPHSECARQS